MDWLAEHWPEVASLALMASGVWWLMPPAIGRPKAIGLALASLGAALLAARLHVATGPLLDTVLFSFFALAAILCSILMITNRKPVYSALWFALATLSVCGLFLLQYAPFLAAATIIVYAGAIVVTFVFVIMLTQQAGTTVYDQRSRQPLAATLAAFVLLAALLATLTVAESLPVAESLRDSNLVGESLRDSNPRSPRRTRLRAAAIANPLSRPPADAALSSMHGLGRSLFGDYLFAVELAGTLLLIATIGAIAIAPRRRRGTL